jgi:hypothetical protein
MILGVLNVVQLREIRGSNNVPLWVAKTHRAGKYDGTLTLSNCNSVHTLCFTRFMRK